ncbi:hypothetical protein H2203_007232 [Taxawa tesnikishii (nom. ined.)]|nr:hypothetical protein H2203_007232 [Dothideales sp. JES 119]
MPSPARSTVRRRTVSPAPTETPPKASKRASTDSPRGTALKRKALHQASAEHASIPPAPASAAAPTPTLTFVSPLRHHAAQARAQLRSRPSPKEKETRFSTVMSQFDLPSLLITAPTAEQSKDPELASTPSGAESEKRQHDNRHRAFPRLGIFAIRLFRPWRWGHGPPPPDERRKKPRKPRTPYSPPAKPTPCPPHAEPTTAAAVTVSLPTESSLPVPAPASSPTDARVPMSAADVPSRTQTPVEMQTPDAVGDSEEDGKEKHKKCLVVKAKPKKGPKVPVGVRIVRKHAG